MNNIGNVNHILKKKNPTYFLSVKLNTLLPIKRCPESGPWPVHLVNHPFYGWRSHIQLHLLPADCGSSRPVVDQCGRDAHL